jgi:hypothetical protein
MLLEKKTEIRFPPRFFETIWEELFLNSTVVFLSAGCCRCFYNSRNVALLTTCGSFLVRDVADNCQEIVEIFAEEITHELWGSRACSGRYFQFHPFLIRHQFGL